MGRGKGQSVSAVQTPQGALGRGRSEFVLTSWISKRLTVTVVTLGGQLCGKEFGSGVKSVRVLTLEAAVIPLSSCCECLGAQTCGRRPRPGHVTWAPVAGPKQGLPCVQTEEEGSAFPHNYEGRITICWNGRWSSGQRQ